MFHYIATAPKAAEPFLLKELESFGAKNIRPTRHGATFEGPLEVGYRACLWSRVASRIVLKLTSFNASRPDELYEGMRRYDWTKHLNAESTLAIFSHSINSDLSHTQFIAQKAKDGVVDQIRSKTGERPDVDLIHPNIRLQLFLENNHAIVGLDLSGESLHARAYRRYNPKAPLKENLAALMLLRADWPNIAAQGGSLLDPMCGSATLPIEAALMAYDIAPGTFRPTFGFTKWLQHDGALWRKLKQEAHERKMQGLQKDVVITGSDLDEGVIKAAHQHLKQADLSDRITLITQDFRDARKETDFGLVITNPPYGERLELPEDLYRELGQTLKEHFSGFKACVLAGSNELGKAMNLWAFKRNAFANGPLECVLLQFEIR